MYLCAFGLHGQHNIPLDTQSSLDYIFLKKREDICSKYKIDLVFLKTMHSLHYI